METLQEQLIENLKNQVSEYKKYVGISTMKSIQNLELEASSLEQQIVEQKKTLQIEDTMCPICDALNYSGVCSQCGYPGDAPTKQKDTQVDNFNQKRLLKDLDDDVETVRNQFKETNIIHAVLFNPCMHESAAGVVSLHWTRKDAEMALEYSKSEFIKEHERELGSNEVFFIKEFTIRTQLKGRKEPDQLLTDEEIEEFAKTMKYEEEKLTDNNTIISIRENGIIDGAKWARDLILSRQQATKEVKCPTCNKVLKPMYMCTKCMEDKFNPSVKD